MTMILAIDPGPTESAFVVYDTFSGVPRQWAKLPNAQMLVEVGASLDADVLVIEGIASYGMSVGAEVFTTCIYIGRFIDRWVTSRRDSHWRQLFRRDVKLHICGSSRAKDANVRQAIIDRYGGKDKAIGRKASPGPLYGLTADCWSALGVAITAAETAAL